MKTGSALRRNQEECRRRIEKLPKSLISSILISLVLILIMASNTSGQYAKRNAEILTLKDLCNCSNSIIAAKVESQKSYYTNNTKHIYTDVCLNITETFKGGMKKEQKLTLKMYGGTIDGITILAVGLPVFITGETSILFLEERSSGKSGYYSIVSANQGKFDLTESGNEIRRKCEYDLYSESGVNKVLMNDNNKLESNDFIKEIKKILKEG